MSDEDAVMYAHPHTLEGLLQRGRGLGAVRALRAPQEAAAFVYDGIRREWRWDGQVDDRSLYLARLVRDLALPLAPVIGQLAEDGDEDAHLRACEVLELLALGGSEEARAALRGYVARGAHWDSVMESMASHWPAEWWQDLGDTARARAGELAEPPWQAEPWTRWGIAVRRHDPAAAGPSLAGLGTDALFALLSDTSTAGVGKVDALRALRSREPVEALLPLLPLVPSLGTSDGRSPLPLVGLVVDRLGELAVPAAREWAADGCAWLARLGADVLADHPSPEALPGLVEELAAQWSARVWCGPDRTARRLARFGPEAAGAAPDLLRFWLCTPHSYERTAYLDALAAVGRTRPDRVHPLLTESLWDCEETARLLGIASAPATREALDRIAELRDDPMETAEVRAAARARLSDDPGEDRSTHGG
ncbi:hypothetical protein ACWCWD_36380 [Streptomyces sp. NPDC001493]